MLNLATVGYTVQVSGLREGEKALDDFGRANVEAAASTKPVEAGLKAVTAAAGDAGAAINTATGRARDARGRFVALGEGTQEVKSKSETAAGAVGKLGKAVDEAGKSSRTAKEQITGVGKATKQAGDQAKESAKDFDFMGMSTDDLIKKMKGLAASMAAFFSVREIARAADEWSDLQSVVGAAVKDMDAAPDLMKRIGDMARSSYSPLQQTAMAFAGNVGALRDLGRGTNDAMAYTEALNNALVVTATRGERATAVQAALGKAMDVGKLQADGLETVLVSGGRVAQALAAELGTTVSGLRQMATDGKITGDVIASSLINRLQDLRDEAAEMPATMADGMTLLRNSFTELVGTWDQMIGASAAVASAIILVADNLQLLVSIALVAATAFATRYAVAVGTTAVAAAYKFIAANVLLHKALFGSSTAAAVTATAVRGLSVALTFLRGAIISTGIGALVVAAGMAVNAFMNLSQVAGGFGNAISLIGAVVREEVTRWSASFAAFGLRVDAVFQDAASFVVRMMAESVSVIGQGVNNWIGAYVGAYEAVKAVWGLLPKAIGDLAFQAANFMIQGIEEMLKAAASRVDSFYNSIANSRMGELFGFETIDIAGSIKFGGVGNPFAGAAAAAGETAGAAFSEGFNRTYVDVDGAVAGLRSISDESAAAATASRNAAGVFDAVANKPNEALAAVKDLMNSTDEYGNTLDDVVVPAANAAGDAAEAAGAKGKEAAEKAAKAAHEWASALEEELTTAIDSASKAFADWTLRGFQDFKSMISSIIDSFKQMLANLIAMAAKNKIMIALGMDPLSKAMSAAGVPGGAAGGAGGWIGSAVGSFANPAAGGVLGGLGGVGAGISSGWAAGGFGGAISGGFGASMAGISGGLAAGGVAGITAAIGAAIPIIAGVAAVFAIGKKLFGRKLKDTGIEGTFEMAEGLAARTYKFYKGGLFRSNKTKREDLDQEAAGPIETAFMGVGESVKGFADQLGLESERINNMSFSFKFSTKGMSQEDISARFQEEMERYGEQAAELVGGAMLKRFAQDGETSVQTLERLATHLTGFNNAMGDLGLRTQAVGLQGADAASNFVQLFGSLEAFNQAATFYFQNFYSLSEQYARAQSDLQEVFDDNGIQRAIPRSAAEFRALVEQLDAMGRTEAVAALMQVAPAFLQMIEMAEELAAAVGGVDPAILEQRAQLERRLMEVQGDTAGLRALEIQQLDVSNRALQRQIWAAEHLNAVNAQRETLEVQLLTLQGNTAELRRRELAELYPANRQLQQRIWQLQREQEVASEREGLERQLLEAQGKTYALRQLELAALAPANRALQQQIWAVERATAVADERRGLEEQLWEITGNTVALRRRELAQLDATNRALQERIWAEEAARAVAEERASLELDLLGVQGNTAELRRRELLELSPANRALQERIWALEDAKEAEEEAAAAVKAIADERKGLETELQTALGNTVWLRRQELAELDASNRALQERIWAITDAQANLAAAQDAARAAADAERERIDEMRSTADAMRDLSRRAQEAAVAVTEAQRMSAERQLRLAIETGKVWDDSLMTMAERVAAVDSSQFSSYNDFLIASSRAASLLSSVADKQEAEALSAEQKLEAALEKYGLSEETVQSLDESLRSLDDAIRQLANAEQGMSGGPGVVPQFEREAVTRVAPGIVDNTPTSALNEQAQTARELRDEVRRLREENNQGNAEIAKNTKRSADTQRKWDVDGMPNIRELIA